MTLLRLGTALVVGQDAASFRCVTCPTELQRKRGCSLKGFAPPVAPRKFRLPSGTFLYSDCPQNIIPARLRRYVRAFVSHEAGRPWYPGAPSQWPARYVQAMRIMGDEAQRIRAADAAAPRVVRGTAPGPGPFPRQRAKP